ncbi:MAG: prolipoprotein diacylglyceryl transferase [Planctomycetota bacterium]
MHSLLFQINTPWFAIPIRAYGVMAALGFLFALVVILRLARKSGLPREFAYDLWFAAFIGGFLGARIWYVVQYWNTDFAGHPLGVFAITSGGLVWYGGIIGGVLGAVFVARRHRRPLLFALDLSIAPATLGLAFGRIGCFLNGCCFGGTTHLPWAVRFPPVSPAFLHQVDQGLIGPDAFSSLPVHPTQLYESAFAFLLFALLYWYSGRRPRTGRAFAVFLLLYPPARIFFEWLRDDIPPWFWGMTPAQVTSVLGVLLGVLLFLRPPRPSKGSAPATSSRGGSSPSRPSPS